jgi:DNA-binding NarL/FixJ family response regulator
MHQTGATALIIAPPGRMRDSWHVLLRASRYCTTVLHADDGPSGLEIIDRQPITWVLLDGDLEDDVWWILTHLRSQRPAVRCLLLVHSAAQTCRALALDEVGTVPVDCSLVRLQDEMRRVQSAYEARDPS